MSTPNARVGYIDGLRAVAILTVVFGHYYMAVYRPGLPRWFDLLGYGYLGVHLFLLLSGVCIGWAYVGPKKKPFVARDFFTRRAARILPAYYVALAISLVLAPPATIEQWIKQTATHLSMTHNLFQDTVLALNGAFWSLALESQLYVTFPLFLVAATRFGWLRALVAVLAFQSIYRVSLMHLGTGYTSTTFVLPWGVLGRVFEFSLGVFLAHLIKTQRLLLPQAVTVGAFVVFAAFGRAAKKDLGVTHPLTDLLWTSAFALFVLSAARPASIVRRILETRVLIRIGEASYSIYLIHSFILGPLVRGVITEASPASVCVAASVPFVLATLALCYPFYWLVERPLLGLGRRSS
jgi:exopolysaccharide production protein ExoZ